LHPYRNCLRLIAFTLGAFTALGGFARASSADYLIHSGDVLNVQVFGEPSLTQNVTVLTDGSIVYPLVGRVAVGGQTLDGATHQLVSALSRYIHSPIVNVAVATEGPLNVLVLGNVKTPGKYAIAPDGRLTDAIAAAGGLGPTDGDFPAARVSNANDTTQTVSLQKLLHDGDVSLNVPLQSDSVVYVPSPSTIRVRVLGAVERPGDIDIGEGDRLSMAIARAGNSNGSNADLNHVHVTRQKDDGTATNFEVNLYRELQDGDIAGDPVLQKGDIVYVPQAKSGANTGSTVLGVLRRLFIPF
jgi:polysaccharide export outer membrane protein